MSSLAFLQSRKLGARGVVSQTGTDKPVALRLLALGVAGTVTSATVTTATDITLVTSNGGTEVFLFSAYATVGALADAISASTYWDCKVLDTLRSYPTATQFVDGVITSSTNEGVVVYDVLVDTSAALYFAYRLTVDRGIGQEKPSGAKRVHLQEIEYFATLGAAAADSVQVWETHGGEETQVIGNLSVSATKTTENFAAGMGKMTSEVGNDLVIVLLDSLSIADAGGNYLTVVGIAE